MFSFLLSGLGLLMINKAESPGQQAVGAAVFGVGLARTVETFAPRKETT